MRLRASLLGLSLLFAVSACAPIPPPRILADTDAIAKSAAVKDARSVAPAAVTRADGLLEAAHRALEEDVYAHAQFLAEQAKASYAEAIAAARLVRAKEQTTTGEKDAAALEGDVSRMETDQARLSAEVERLKAELAILTDAERPKPSGATSPERERARARAARAYVTEARIYCATARVTQPQKADAAITSELAANEKLLGEIEARLGDGAPPIDGATRVRAACLELLTRSRRDTKASSDATLTFLDELSAFAQKRPGMAVERDARGVVVRIERPFEGDALSSKAKEHLAELDKVLAAHPELGVAVVAHAGEVVADKKLDARKTLLDGILRLLPSSPDGRKLAFDARNFLPIVDPEGKDKKANARLEVIFFAAAAQGHS